MSERYSRLYSLPERLYIENAPLTVAAGTLLKDNSTGRVLAQLKFKNICDKTIKAVTVRVTPLDTVGRPLGGSVEFQYLDLNAPRDSEFGQQTPVWLPDAATRSFSVQVIEVAFANNTLWADSISIWEPLPGPITLEDKLGDAELAHQYRLTYGNACINWPTEVRDLWYCTCGALNRGTEDNCHTCGRVLNEYKSIDLKALTAEKDARLKKEAAEHEEAARLAAERLAREQAEAEERRAREAEAEAKAKAAAEAHAKKVKKIAMIVTPLVVVAAVLAVLTVKVFIPNAKYNAAEALLQNGQYEEAIVAFEALGEYNNSRERIEEAKNAKKYDEAEALLVAEKFQDAIRAFRSLGLYRDSQARIDEANYKAAKSDLAQGDYLKALRSFQSSNGYEDTDEQISILTEKLYTLGMESIHNADFSVASKYFEAIRDYSDSQSWYNYASIKSIVFGDGKQHKLTGIEAQIESIEKAELQDELKQIPQIQVLYALDGEWKRTDNKATWKFTDGKAIIEFSDGSKFTHYLWYYIRSYFVSQSNTSYKASSTSDPEQIIMMNKDEFVVKWISGSKTYSDTYRRR